jgi:acetyltransferase-like isoleucine patch superfamily enzyme
MTVNDLTGVWDYSSLPPNITIGRDCYLENRQSFRRFRSTRNPGLVLGDGVYVYCWTAFSIEPSGIVTVGDDSTLVGASFWCSERITVGARVVISHNVIVADADFHPRDPAKRREDAIAVSPDRHGTERPPYISKPVTIDDDVSIGIGAIVLKGVHIGARARIEAGAIVTSDVPPDAVVAGNPGKLVPPEVQLS